MTYSPPHSGADYALVAHRFKLLNLVQRVAHTDVMNMVEAIGLDALACHHSGQWLQQGLSTPASAAQWEEPEGRHTLSDKLHTRPHRVTTRRTNADVRVGTTRANNTSDNQVRRSPGRPASGASDRRAFYSRLAAPRPQKGSPVMESFGEVVIDKQREGQHELHLVRSPKTRRVASPPQPSWRQLQPYAIPAEGNAPPLAPPPFTGTEPHPSNPRDMLPHVGPPSGNTLGDTELLTNTLHQSVTSSCSVTAQSSMQPPPRDSRLSDGVGADVPHLPLPAAPDYSSLSSVATPQAEGHRPLARQPSAILRRALGAKAKPKGAQDSPRVPMEAIRHAAALISSEMDGKRPQWAQTLRSPAVPQPAGLEGRCSASYSPQPLAIASGDLLRHPLTPSASTAPLPPEAELTRDEDGGIPVADNRGSLPLGELARAIDKMLDDHQHILAEVVDQTGRDGRRDVADGSSTHDEAATAGCHRRPSKGNDTENIMEAVDLSLELSSDPDDDVADEMLLYARVQEKLNRMDADIERLEEHRRNDVYEDFHMKQQTLLPRTPTQEPQPLPPPRRKRGDIPNAVTRRLQAYRAEAHEYIAYNEKLWNTSSTSQFAFAQRLTHALFEDCLSEVVTEVAGIMDEYVEGLAENELQ